MVIPVLKNRCPNKHKNNPIAPAIVHITLRAITSEKMTIHFYYPVPGDFHSMSLAHYRDLLIICH